LEVLELSKQIILLGQLTIVSALSTPNGGEGYNSSTESSIQLQGIQARSPHPADKTTSKPQAKCFMEIYSSTTSMQYPIHEFKNKYPKRVGLATKYLSLINLLIDDPR
jgi:hypothetical protein